MGSFLQDLRYGLRILAKSPSFTAVAVVTIALGIACTTAIFSIVNAAIFQPLRYGHPNRLVLVWLARPNGSYSNAGVTTYRAFRDDSSAFEQLAAEEDDDFDLRGNPPVRLHAARVTPNFFEAVSVEPQIGRVFSTREAESDARVVVLSNAVWVRDFGSDPDIVGRTVSLNGDPWTVIGVMPRGFEFIRADDVWVPLDVGRDRQTTSILLIGSLKKGVTASQAQAELDPIAARLAREYPKTNQGFPRARVMPLRDFLLGRGARLMMLALLGAVGFVLLIACANVSNLLLARGSTRQKEIATRMAVGATRGRIATQLLIESFLLAIVGAALGLAWAYWAVDYLTTLPLLRAPGAAPVSIDAAVLAFAVGTTVLVTLIFGLLPAWQTSNVDLMASVKPTSAAAIAGVRSRRLRSGLVIAEITLSVMLLAGAGLMIRTFMNVAETPGGFRPDRVLVADISLSTQRYPSDDSVRNFYESLLQRVRALPGVQSADTSSTLPLEGWRLGIVVHKEGQPDDAEHRLNVNLQLISDSYFKTMGIAMLRGRTFTPADTASSMPVAIINQQLARRLFKDEDPIGKRIYHDVVGLSEHTAGTVQVIGISADVKDEALDQPASEAIYLPFEQAPVRWSFLDVRSVGNPDVLLPAIRRAVAAMDPDQPIEQVTTMEQILGESLASRRFSMILLGVFACIALVLAAVGIYGVIAYLVAQRTAEFGLRIALGAKPAELLALVMRNGLKLAAIGCTLGIGGAAVLGRAMRSMVYGVSATDPLTFVAAACVIVVVASLAILVPARRATKVDPMVALRYE